MEKSYESFWKTLTNDPLCVFRFVDLLCAVNVFIYAMERLMFLLNHKVVFYVPFCYIKANKLTVNVHFWVCVSVHFCKPAIFRIVGLHMICIQFQIHSLPHVALLWNACVD